MSTPEFAPKVAQQAVYWLLEMQQAPLTPPQQQAWQQWLNADEHHRRAWEHVQNVNQRLRGVNPALAHAALGAPRSGSRRRMLQVLLMLGMGTAVGLGLRQQQLLPPLLADYRSARGERRQMALSDGSQIHLNTASAVDVRFDNEQRLIHLLEGEVLVNLAADTRPLRVLSAQGTIQASTGRLGIRQLAGHTRLTVLAGEAQVQLPSMRGYPQRLDTGREVNFTSSAWGIAQVADVNSSAWVDGMLVAAHMRLADFLGELGRYRRGELACDPAVANLLISGSYPLADTDRVLDLLATSLPVKIRRLTRFWVTVQARA